jgi:hypothetical protein
MILTISFTTNSAKQITTIAEADKATLLRRVSLDLIGMPAPGQHCTTIFK